MHYINKTRFFSLFLALTLLFTLILSYAKSAGNNIADSVVRLHIIANSNTEADQQLKLKVRNQILKQAAPLFDQTANAAQALTLAEKHSEFLKEIAEDEIHRLGFDYPVSVSVEKSAFPTKAYGKVVLPAGNYNAVKIRIGEASGENWWCVMYPPLCFTDGILSVSENAKAQLKSNLSKSEYELITQSSSSVPVEIKFKLVEIIQSWF